MNSRSLFILALAFMAASLINSEIITVTVFDHYPTINGTSSYPSRFSPDFEPLPPMSPNNVFTAKVVTGMVASPLVSGNIKYAGRGNEAGVPRSNDAVWNSSTFATWFTNTPGINIPLQLPLDFTKTLVPGTTDLYNLSFEKDGFFPIDGQGFCDTKVYNTSNGFDCSKFKAGTVPHNFHFCFHWSSYFTFKQLTNNPMKFNFWGDDDVWVYFNKILRIDLGGIHGKENATYSPSTADGFVDGQQYDFDFFYCERKTSGSNIKIQTNMGLACNFKDYCGVCDGDGSTCCNPSKCVDSNACNIATCPSPTATGVDSTNYLNHCTFTQKTCPNGANCATGYCDTLSGCKTFSCNSTSDVCLNPVCNTNFGCQKLPVDCGQSDKCTERGCSGGCYARNTAIANNCKSDTNKCLIFSCDPLTGCSNTTKKCAAKDICTTRSCVPATGECQDDTPKPGCNPNCGGSGTCDTSNQCNTYSCSGNACVATPINSTDTNRCRTPTTCNPTNGQFSFIYKDCTEILALDSCYPSPTCDVATGVCSKGEQINCDDGNECTVDTCSNGECQHTARVCDDGDKCTTDSCNPLVAGGCVATKIECTTESLCQVAACDSSTGECVSKERVCESPNFCDISKCNDKVGCITVPRECVADEPDCASSSCDYTEQKCVDESYDPLPFNCQSAAVKTGVALGAAATAGIIIAGAVAIGMAVFGGKKGYDHWKNTRDSKMSAAVVNPLFQASNNSVENPLFEHDGR